jgi:hypothetical protein
MVCISTFIFGFVNVPFVPYSLKQLLHKNLVQLHTVRLAVSNVPTETQVC